MDILIDKYLQTRKVELPDTINESFIDSLIPYLHTGFVFYVLVDKDVVPTFAPLELYDAICELLIMAAASPKIQSLIGRAKLLPREFYAVATSTGVVESMLATTHKSVCLDSKPFTPDMIDDMKNLRHRVYNAYCLSYDSLKVIPYYLRLADLPHYPSLLYYVNSVRNIIMGKRPVEYQVDSALYSLSLAQMATTQRGVRNGKYAKPNYLCTLRLDGEEVKKIGAKMFFHHMDEGYGRMASVDRHILPAALIIGEREPQSTMTGNFPNENLSRGSAAGSCHIMRLATTSLAEFGKRPNNPNISVMHLHKPYSQAKMENSLYGYNPQIEGFNPNEVEIREYQMKVGHVCLNSGDLHVNDVQAEVIRYARERAQRHPERTGWESDDSDDEEDEYETDVEEEGEDVGDADTPEDGVGEPPNSQDGSDEEEDAVDNGPRQDGPNVQVPLDADVAYIEDRLKKVQMAWPNYPTKEFEGQHYRADLYNDLIHEGLQRDEIVDRLSTYAPLKKKDDGTVLPVAEQLCLLDPDDELKHELPVDHYRKDLVLLDGVRSSLLPVVPYAPVPKKHGTLLRVYPEDFDSVCATDAILGIAVYMDHLVSTNMHPIVFSKVDGYTPHIPRHFTRAYCKLREIFGVLSRDKLYLPQKVVYLEPSCFPGGMIEAASSLFQLAGMELCALFGSYYEVVPPTSLDALNRNLQPGTFCRIMKTGAVERDDFVTKHIDLTRGTCVNFLVCDVSDKTDSSTHRSNLYRHYKALLERVASGEDVLVTVELETDLLLSRAQASFVRLASYLRLLDDVLVIGGMAIIKVIDCMVQPIVDLLYEFVARFATYYVRRLAYSRPYSKEVYLILYNRLEECVYPDRTEFDHCMRLFNDTLLLSLADHCHMMITNEKGCWLPPGMVQVQDRRVFDRYNCHQYDYMDFT